MRDRIKAARKVERQAIATGLFAMTGVFVSLYAPFWFKSLMGIHVLDFCIALTLVAQLTAVGAWCIQFYGGAESDDHAG